MSVVGFDFGGQSCVVAVAKKRGIETVQNSVGNRQTASLVSYQGKQRFIGDAATPLMRSNAKNSVRYVKRILGLRNDDPSVQEEQSYISAPLVKGEDGLIRVKVNYEDKQQELRPEVVTSALLSELKGTAERSLGNRVSDCVISVPHYWPDGRRRALLDAAKAANLNVLRLFNENTAVALKYGILRPLPENETRVVAFVDFGQTQFSASLVSFTTGELKVLATTADTTLGCRNLDRILAEHFVEEIKTKFKMDVSTNPKAMIKLMKECERVKKTLSANTTVNWNVEYIMNDKDVRGEIKRETFEAAIKAKLKSRFEAVLAKLFEQPGAKDVVKEKLHSIEIIGGGVRIPAVQQIISGFFGGGDLSKTCDGDESVAHGCAWQCAMLSPSFQVKRFEVKDICPFAIEVAWGPGAKPIKRFQMGVENEEKCTLVFQPGNLIPSKKMVSFKNRQGPFNVVGRYADPVPQYADRYIGEFQPKIPNAKENPPKVKLTLQLDLNSCLVMQAAHTHKVVQVEVEDTEAMQKAAAEAKAKADAEAEAEAKAKPMDTEAEVPKTEGDGAAAAGDSGAKAEGAEAAAKPMDTTEEPPKKAAEPLPKIMKTVDKKVKEEYEVESVYRFGLDSGEYKSLYEQETYMAGQDRIIIETSEARNALEGYYLEMRSMVDDEYGLGAYATQADREAFVDLCRKAEAWVEGDGWDAQKSEYVKELKKLQEKGNPIKQRQWEAENRGAAADKFKKVCLHYERWSSTTEEKYAHIDSEKRAEVTAKANEADKWLVATLIEQEKLPKTSDPVLTVNSITQKQKELCEFCDKIISTPKPKPKPKKEEPKENKDGGKPEQNSEKSKKAKKENADEDASTASSPADAATTGADNAPEASDAAPMDTSS